jgi:hypothetical protein
MDNLIFLPLPWLSNYDPFLMSTEYPHNHWFQLKKIEQWSPHITSRAHKLDTPWPLAPTVCPIPEFDHAGETKFDHVMDSIAEKFCQRVKKTGRRPYVCWSGGIDSTAVMVAILRVADAEVLNQLVVLLSKESIIENAYFYKYFIKDKFVTENIDDFVLDESNYNKVLITNGEAGNQIMGNYHITRLMRMNQSDLLKQSWRSISNFNEVIPNSTPFLINMITESINHTPVPIETVYDFLWWSSFNFKFDAVLIRKMFVYARHLNSIQTKDLWKNGMMLFFAEPEMQNWSMASNNIRRESLAIDSKYTPKKYIYDFDHNDIWFAHKGEEGSGTPLYYYNYLIPSRPVFAYDSNWNMYNIKDQSTRIALGKILQRA